MKIKHFLLPLPLLAAQVACNNYSTEQKHKETQKPNIIFILADDLGWRDVGFNGSKYYETPNLDQLAKNGTQFTNAYTNAPNSAPTRASILTGLYPQRHGIVSVKTSMKGDKKRMKLMMLETKTELDTSFTILPEVMKKAGYNTAFFGKWHLGEDPADGPIAHGFDYNIGGCHQGSPKSYFSPYKNPTLKDGTKGENLTDRLTDEVIKYIENTKKDNPFFVYLSYYAVHAPFQTTDSLKQKYQNKKTVDGQTNPVYAGMIETLDNNIGKLNQYLEKQNLSKNTLIIFISDNGGSFRATVNTPLRGSKGMLREGGIRVPCFFYQPGTVPKGKIVDVPVITTDIFPTIAHVAKTSLNTKDGESIWPLVTENTKLKREAIYWYQPVYLGGKPEKGYYFRLTPSAAIRKGEYKLIYFFENNSVELFNVVKDISETEELSQKMPDKTTELKTELLEWLNKTNAKIEFEKNSIYDSTLFDNNIKRIY